MDALNGSEGVIIKSIKRSDQEGRRPLFHASYKIFYTMIEGLNKSVPVGQRF